MDNRLSSPKKPWAPRRGASPDEVSRRLASIAFDYPTGYRIPVHHHAKAQLVFASCGVMTVTTADGSWVVPPQRAVWVPGGTDHRIAMSGAVSMRTLYFSRDVSARLPARCCVMGVSPLLRELVLRAVDFEPLYDEAGREGRMVDVLLDELAAMQVAPLHLPLPADPRLRGVVDGLQADPADGRGLDAWARTVGASARTLARLFDRETGMSFGAWRQQLRLSKSLELLAQGHSVTNVALSLGYESPSAFISMFRRHLGATPGRYFSAAAAGTGPLEPGESAGEGGGISS
jgi:AraC-like DNA-binding protein